MMQTPDLRNRDDWAEFRRLDWPSVRRVLVEREMSSSAVIVREVRGQDATQVAFAQDDDMIEALAPHGADDPFRKRILPRTPRRREDFSDAQTFDTMSKRLAVDRVAIAEEISRRGVVGEGLHDLLGRPFGGGMLGHVEVDEAPTMVGEHDQDEEDA